MAKILPGLNPWADKAERERDRRTVEELLRQAVGGSSPSHQALETVEGVVTAMVPEFEQVDVESADGRSFVINRSTEGVRMNDLHEGQRLILRVLMRGSSKVVHAAIA